MSTSQGTVRNGDMVDLPTAEVDRINSMKPGALIEIEEAAVFKAAKPKAKHEKSPRYLHQWILLLISLGWKFPPWTQNCFLVSNPFNDPTLPQSFTE